MDSTGMKSSVKKIRNVAHYSVFCLMTTKFECLGGCALEFYSTQLSVSSTVCFGHFVHLPVFTVQYIYKYIHVNVYDLCVCVVFLCSRTDFLRDDGRRSHRGR